MTAPMVNRLVEKLEEVDKKLDIWIKAGSRRPHTHTTEDGSLPKKMLPQCIFCHGQHTANSCSVYTTSEARWARLGVLNGCRHCGSVHHLPSKCSKRARKCWTCGDAHLSAMCVSTNTAAHVDESSTSVYTAQSSMSNASTTTHH